MPYVALGTAQADADQVPAPQPNLRLSGRAPKRHHRPPFGHEGDNGGNLLADECSRARWEGHENVQIVMSEKQHNIRIAALVLGIATMHSFLLSLEPLRPVMNGVPVIGNVPFKRMFPLLCFPP